MSARLSLRAALAVAATATLLLTGTAGGAHAAGLQGPTLPANDLESLLSLTSGKLQQPWGGAVMAPAPALKAVPRADCGPGSRPLAGEQGRVTADDIASPAASDGWTCNLDEVGNYPMAGGFRVWRYVDPAGHECAYYDTSLQSPGAIVSALVGPSPGVAVLDMSDPEKPVRTALLTTAAMLVPHESLNLNTKRGLLAAEVGNGTTLPGSMAIYDVSHDCRRPELQAQMPTAYGHESGFAPDGNTYWVAGGAGTVTAVDVTNPKLPHVVWTGFMYSHGLNLSADGRTLYQTDPINGNLGILDVSEVQDRKPDPTVRQISRITWNTVSIPQNSVPLTIRGRPYLLEFDEFAFRFNPATIADRAGAARLIDISDPAKPRVTSDLRLAVNMEAEHAQAANDPAPLPGSPFAYGAHYCAAPRTVDPEIVACSFLNSGLRVFNVSDPEHPREVGYFVAPPKAGTVAGIQAGNLAFSQPAFDPVRRQVWYSDGTSGFWALRLSPTVWPNPTSCTSTRRVTVTLPRSAVRRGARVRYLGRNAAIARAAGGRLRATVDLAGRPAGKVTVVVTGRTRAGRAFRQVRRFTTCVAPPNGMP